MLIAGTSHKEIQKKLLSKDNKLTLEEGMREARNHEASIKHMEQLKITQGVTANISSIKDTKHSSCPKCGTKHQRGKCPAFGAECHSCGKKNHWKKMCRSKREDNSTRSKSKKERSKKFNEIRQDYTSEESDEFSMLSMPKMTTIEMKCLQK